jgi:hypothetical protein
MNSNRSTAASTLYRILAHPAAIGAVPALLAGFGRSIDELLRRALVLAVIKPKSSSTSNAPIGH